jgi:hypothetical protein
MSGVPAMSDTVPSSFTVRTEVSPPMLNQKLEATPRAPSNLRSGVFQCSVFDRAEVSETNGPEPGSVRARAPVRRVHQAELIGSRPSFWRSVHHA